MNLTTTLFTTTFTLVVAAGLVELDAGPEADGPARKPAMHEADLGGRHLQVSLDRERVPAGEAVRLTITATEHAGPASETLRVTVLEQTGSPMSRSMSPPREVSHQDVQLGSEPVALALTLAGVTPPGADAPDTDPLAIAGHATQYTVVVTAVGPAAANAKDDGGVYLPVFAYQPEAYRLTIEPPAAGKPGLPIDIAVRVTSLAAKPLTGIAVGVSSELVAIDDAARIDSLAPGAEQVVHLHGRRVEVAEGPVLLQAFGTAAYGGNAEAWATVDAAHGTLVARASEPSSPGGLGL